MQLYEVDNDYINYLKQFDEKVLHYYDKTHFHSRKYLGILLSINNCFYIAPLSSPSSTDYNNGIIRKSIVPIIRITKSKNTVLLGKIKLSSMIPIFSTSVIKKYNVKTETDLKYKNLILDQLHFIHSNKNLILKYANTLYLQKLKNLPLGYIKNTVNFTLLEEKAKLYKTIV